MQDNCVKLQLGKYENDVGENIKSIGELNGNAIKKPQKRLPKSYSNLNFQTHSGI